MPFEQIAPEKVSIALHVESGDWGRTWTLVFFYEAQLSTVQPFCSNANESVAFQYLVRLLVKEIEGKTNIACNLRGNYSLTTENDRSSFENLLLPGEIGLPSISFLHELFITQLQIQDVAAKKRRSQTSPPLPPLITHSSYPSPPLPSIFHHSVLTPVPIWYHIQTLILFKCSTKLSFKRLTIGEIFSLFWVN